MGQFNSFTILGNLTRDPEIRDAGDTKVCNFGIAANRKRGEREEVLYADVECWGKTAELVAEWKRKGDELLVVGRMKTDKWQDKETGANRTKTVFVAQDIQFTGRKDDAGEAQGERERDRGRSEDRGGYGKTYGRDDDRGRGRDDRGRGQGERDDRDAGRERSRDDYARSKAGRGRYDDDEDVPF